MEIDISKPTMVVFAGNNGSGKSTFRNIITEKHGVMLNIDPDALARKYKDNAEIKAGRDSINLVKEQKKPVLKLLCITWV